MIGYIILISTIISCIVLYVVFAIITINLNKIIYKEAGMNPGFLQYFINGLLWPGMIKTSIKGYKDIIIGSITQRVIAITANNAPKPTTNPLAALFSNIKIEDEEPTMEDNKGVEETNDAESNNVVEDTTND